MPKRAATQCPHCQTETYLLQAKAAPTMVQPIGKGIRIDVRDGSTHWNCAKCGAEHVLFYDVSLAKSGPPRLTPRVKTLPPPIPVLPIRREPS